MSQWATVSAGDASQLTLALPPRWWSIHPVDYGRDVQAIVSTSTRQVPSASTVPAELTDELGRLARVGAATGAVLLAGGSATDPDTGQLVTASLTIVPPEVYASIDHTGWEPGPDIEFSAPAGPTRRQLWLGPEQTVFGRALMLTAEYLVRPAHQPAWVLIFQTPALAQRLEMVTVFDVVTGTLRVRRPAASVMSAFS
jgi:hypothetical protein